MEDGGIPAPDCLFLRLFHQLRYGESLRIFCTFHYLQDELLTSQRTQTQVTRMRRQQITLRALALMLEMDIPPLTPRTSLPLNQSKGRDLMSRVARLMIKKGTAHESRLGVRLPVSPVSRLALLEVYLLTKLFLLLPIRRGLLVRGLPNQVGL